MRNLCLALLLSGSLLSPAQQPTTPLTSEQQALFDAAKKDFGEHHPDAALVKMKQLVALRPEDATVVKGTAETAVTAGDTSYAITLLKPWTAAHSEDYAALELLARAYAESGQKAERDQTVAAVLALHAKTTDPRFQRADRFLLERIKVTNELHLDLFYALVPFSPYKIHVLGRLADARNALALQITLESADGDQPLFARQHPELASKGIRAYSLDAYKNNAPAADGSLTQTHYTFALLDGDPGYDATRQRMLDIATGKASPMSSRSGIPVPKN
ncbi:tetratricopeptide repeat protein [Granulicella cerasi]|uniref:Tetratricopeptide repeat protein n=1 Tax=Granulicella cerasi TaxID=741063 RepID=A0ABW1Z604_9BACT|nr:hypothetical protein [Granulicella cerasi]